MYCRSLNQIEISCPVECAGILSLYQGLFGMTDLVQFPLDPVSLFKTLRKTKKKERNEFMHVRFEQVFHRLALNL